MQDQLNFDTSQFTCAGFSGEIMLRLLKMLVLPLVAGSMIAGVNQRSMTCTADANELLCHNIRPICNVISLQHILFAQTSCSWKTLLVRVSHPAYVTTKWQCSLMLTLFHHHLNPASSARKCSCGRPQRWQAAERLWLLPLSKTQAVS